MSKFDSVLAEAAYLVSLNGFSTEEFGTSEELTGWNALIELASYDPIVAEQFPDAHFPLSTVWIREDNNGFVDIMGSAPIHDNDRVLAEWNSAMEDYYNRQ